MKAKVNLANLELTLNHLAEECIELGTPFSVRRQIKDVLRMLPVIEKARAKK